MSFSLVWCHRSCPIFYHTSCCGSNPTSARLRSSAWWVGAASAFICGTPSAPSTTGRRPRSFCSSSQWSSASISSPPVSVEPSSNQEVPHASHPFVDVHLPHAPHSRRIDLRGRPKLAERAHLCIAVDRIRPRGRTALDGDFGPAQQRARRTGEAGSLHGLPR